MKRFAALSKFALALLLAAQGAGVSAATLSCSRGSASPACVRACAEMRLEHRARYGDAPALYGMHCVAGPRGHGLRAVLAAGPRLGAYTSPLGSTLLGSSAALRLALPPALRLPQPRAPDRFARSGSLPLPPQNAPPIPA